MARARFLIGMIRNNGHNYEREDDEVFYDKRLDAMLYDGAQIITGRPNLSRPCCTVTPCNTDTYNSMKFMDGDDRRKTLKFTQHEQLEIDAPDAWI